VKRWRFLISGLLFFLAGSSDGWSQYAQLRFVPSFDCSGNPDIICVAIEIRSGATPGSTVETGTEEPFAIGTSSIYFTYNSNALNYSSYQSFNFNETIVCTPPGLPLYDTLRIDFLQSGIINATINYANVSSLFGFGCPEIGSCWLPMYEICFEISNASQSSNFTFSTNPQRTSFNTDFNDGLNQVPTGVFVDVDIPLDCTLSTNCAGSDLALTADPAPYYCGENNDTLVNVTFTATGGAGCNNFYNVSNGGSVFIDNSDGDNSVSISGFMGDYLEVEVVDQDGCSIITGVSIICQCEPPIGMNLLSSDCQNPPNFWTAEIEITGGNPMNDNFFQVSDEGGNTINVPIGETFSYLIPNCSGIDLEITDQYGCTYIGTVPTFSCVFDGPVPPEDVYICAGGTTSLSVTSLPDFNVGWYSDASGTDILHTGTGFIYTNPTSGTIYLNYFSAECSSMMSSFNVIVYDELIISEEVPPTCNVDHISYAYSFSISGGDATNYTIDTDIYNYTESGGIYTIAEIPAGTDLTISVNSTLGSSGEVCTYSITITSPSCTCNVPDPVISEDIIYYCPEIPTSDIPALSVADPGPGFEVWWLENPTDTSPVWTGNSYPVGQAGTYYVAISDGANCLSPASPITLEEMIPVSFDLIDTDCNGPQNYNASFQISGGHPDIPNPTVFYTLGTGLYTAMDDGNANYHFTNVPIGNDIAITAVSPYSCTGTYTISSPLLNTCECPSLPAPVVEATYSYCIGESLPVIHVAENPLYIIEWYNGTDTDPVFMGADFQPGSEGEYFVLYEDFEGENINCSSESVPFEVIENPLPTASFSSSVCAIDLASYTAQFTVNGFSPFTFDGAGVQDLGGGLYELDSLAIGQDYIITITDAEGCDSQLTLNAPESCACPPIDAPISQSEIACSDSPVTEIMAGPELADYTMVWYSDLQGTQELATGLSIPNPDSGTYYVRYESQVNDCLSGFTAVIVQNLSPFILSTGVPLCATDNASFSIDITVSGSSGSGYSVNGSGTIVDLANGVFTVSSLDTIMDSYEFVIQDSEGCDTTLSVLTPECNICPTIPQPQVPNQTYCETQNNFILTVPTVPANLPGYYAAWYDNFSGNGNPLHIGYTYETLDPGVYYVQYTNGTCEGNLDPATLTINQALDTIAYTTSCSADLQFYQINFAITGGSGEIETVELLPANAGTVTLTLPVSVNVANVSSNQSFSIMVTDDAGCTAQYDISPPACDCGDIPEPLNPTAPPVCPDSSGPYTLSVDNPDLSLYTIEWYDGADPLSAMLVGNGTSIEVDTIGTYYTFAVLDVCYSSGIPILLIPEEEVQFIVNGTSCFQVSQEYNLTYSFIGPAVSTVDIIPNTLTATAVGDVFSINGIPYNINPEFSVTDINGCIYQFTYENTCVCNPISPPTGQGSYFFCAVNAPYQLSIDTNFPADLTPMWEDENGNPIGNSSSVNVSEGGTYTVYFQDAISCESSSLVVNVTVLDELELGDLVSICNPDLSYQYNFSVTGGEDIQNYSATDLNTGSVYSVSDNGNDTYTLGPIPSDVSVSLQMEDISGCTLNEELPAVNCSCPVIAVPTGPVDLVLCATDGIPSFSAIAESGMDIIWTNDISGIDVITQGPDFNPLSIGTYYVFAVDPITDCRSLPLIFTLSVLDALVLNNPDATCVGITEYEFTVDTSGGSGNGYILSAESYLVTDTGNGQFMISGVPSGESVSLTLTDDHPCTTTLTVGPINCNCPVINMPTGPEDVMLCSEEVIPALTAIHEVDQTLLWSSDMQGNMILSEDEIFTASDIGVYYVLAVSPDGDCFSAADSFEIARYDVITIANSSFVCDDEFNGSFTLELAGGSGYGFIIDAGGYVVSDMGGNIFTISDIPADTAIDIIVTDAGDTDCTKSFSLMSPSCTLVCTVLNATLAAPDDYYCTDLTELNLIDFLLPSTDTDGLWTELSGAIQITQNLLPLTGLSDGDLVLVYEVFPPLTDPVNCDPVSDTLTLVIKEEGIVQFSVPDVICNDEAGIIQLNDYILNLPLPNGIWTNDLLSPLNGTNGLYDLTAQVPGVYTFLLTPAADECSEPISLDLIIQDCTLPEALYISTAFSPNGDGLNDRYKPIVFGTPTFQEIYIYDRWGELLYSEVGTDQLLGWDGYYNGMEQEIGVYVYYMRINLSGIEKMYKGNLTLIR